MSGFKIANAVLKKYTGKEENPVIPDGVVEIGDNAFSYAKIRSLVIPEGVVKIGNGAFDSCDMLESITLPDTLETIGDDAFAFCEKLGEVNLPPKVRSLGCGAFAYCESLKKVTFPDGIVDVENIFSNCPIEEIILPDSVKSVYGLCFFCKKLKKVRLPQGLEEIGYQAFYGCYALEEIENFFPSVQNVDENAFYGCNLLPEEIKEAVLGMNPSAFDADEEDLQTMDEIDEAAVAEREKPRKESLSPVSASAAAAVIASVSEAAEKQAKVQTARERVIHRQTVPEKAPLSDFIPREERIYVEETGKKSGKIAAAFFNGLFPIALIWVLFDGGAIIGMITGGVFSDPKMLALLLFFAIHLFPVYIYIGRVVKGIRAAAASSAAVTDVKIYFKNGQCLSSVLLSQVKTARTVQKRGRKRNVSVILKNGDKLLLTELTDYEEFESRIIRLIQGD